jgi:hypothetical protein
LLKDDLVLRMDGLSLNFCCKFHVNVAEARHLILMVVVFEEKVNVALVTARLIAKVAAQTRSNIDDISANHAL